MQLIKPDPRVERLIRDYGTGTNLGLKGQQDWDPPPSVLVMNKVDAIPRCPDSILLLVYFTCKIVSHLAYTFLHAFVDLQMIGASRCSSVL